MKLVSTYDVQDKAGQPYLSTDRRDVDGNPVWGRGEVYVRGINVSTGYYMMPDKTKMFFDEDGFFHTGDIGQYASDGSLQIVDRKKNLVKLKGGEYVALERMEMAYGESVYVDAVAGGIMCHADGEMDRPMGIMQVNEVEAKKWAKANGKESLSFDELIQDADFYQEVLDDMKKQHSATKGLSHLEKLAALALIQSPWTPENNCLTAANKLNRRVIQDNSTKDFEAARSKCIF